MLRGHVFKFQTFANEAFAHFINTFLQGNMGITKGCNLSHTNNSVTISSGYFCVMGRFLEIIGNETISDISNTGYYQLICEIDLTKTNTNEELNQAVIKLVRNLNGYTNLTKEDLFNGGSIYQYEFARFKVTEQGITEFSDRRTFLNLESLYSQINNNFNNLFNEKDQEADELLEEISDELANVMDGSTYLLKAGGDMAGNINMSENGIKFSNNGYIEWKENGYGDKFRIIPDFNGADDNNKLIIQGAVGGAGENPNFVDIGYITAQNGNFVIKGNITAPNFIGNVNGNVTGNCSGSSGTCTGNASSATKLQTARTINGTSFNGTGNITTSKWGTSRTLALSGAVSGSTNIDGGGNVTINTTQNNIAVINGTITFSNGSGHTTVAYPNGYNYSNCIVLSLGISIYDSGIYCSFSEDFFKILFATRLQANNVYVAARAIEAFDLSATRNFQLVLMKIS